MPNSATAEELFSLQQVALYGTVSFMLVSVMGVFLYITCSRRYRLNWFEKNLLETARESRRNLCDDDSGSNAALMVGAGQPGEHHRASNATTIDERAADTISQRSLHNRSPVSVHSTGGGGVLTSGGTDDPTTFWVPAKVQRQLNADAAAAGAAGAAAAAAAAAITSADESLPMTPTSPTGSQASTAFSIGSGASGISMPIARSERHVVLTNMSPARPKVASMQAKLDPAKLDMSLYDNQTVDLNPTEPEASYGMVHVSLTYDVGAGNLTVRLHEVIKHNQKLIC